MADDSETKILLAAAHSLFREAMRAVLENEPDLNVVGEAQDTDTACFLAALTVPNVALVDEQVTGGTGVTVAAAIKERVPDCRVVFLSGQEDQSILLDAVEAGVSAYLTKDCAVSELIEATRAVQRGATLIPGHMLGGLLAALMRRHRKNEEASRLASKLTRREREVLALLAEGADNDAIARALVITPQTARTHIQNILGKLGVHSRLEAAALVMQNGLLDDLVRAPG